MLRAALLRSALLLGPLLAQGPGVARVTATATGAWQVQVGDRTYRCAVGKGGVAAPGTKVEGDGKTPAGTFPLRTPRFRPDRIAASRLPAAWKAQPLRPEDGWCDAPADLRYNLPVTRPYPASHEALWREDGLYDLLVPLGYNDDPIVPGRGSAIFFHLASPDYGPTAGCVAVSLPDLLEILTALGPGARMEIQAPGR